MERKQLTELSLYLILSLSLKSLTSVSNSMVLISDQLTYNVWSIEVRVSTYNQYTTSASDSNRVLVSVSQVAYIRDK